MVSLGQTFAQISRGYQYYLNPPNSIVEVDRVLSASSVACSRSTLAAKNLRNGRQSLLVVPEGRGNVPHKKAEIEMQSLQCTENCDLLNKQ